MTKTRKRHAGFYPHRHPKGIGCQNFYDKQREERKCSCGRDGIGLTKYDSPVCSFHNSFPTEKVKNFPLVQMCPGPHYKPISEQLEEIETEHKTLKQFLEEEI
jgi:hypothetical protein